VVEEYREDAMDSFLEKLADSRIGGQSSDHLKLLGKRAAGLYMGKEADSLNAAVASVVGGEDLNRDQVRRVAEMANQATWREAFHDGGEAVHFDPANADEVMGELAVKPEEVSDDFSSMDYLNDVPNQTQNVDWENVFEVKADTPEYDALNSVGEDEAKVEKVASALDLARHGVDRLLVELSDTGEEFYQMVKQAHLRDGYGILQISQAVGQAVHDPSYATTIMKQASERLQREGVTFNERRELEKLAHPLVVNTDHPLMQKAAILEKLSFSYYSASNRHEELRNAHRVAHKALRDKLRDM
jgi:hypothetical protein